MSTYCETATNIIITPILQDTRVRTHARSHTHTSSVCGKGERIVGGGGGGERERDLNPLFSSCTPRPFVPLHFSSVDLSSETGNFDR